MYNDPFINILPSLDIHGYTSDMMFVPVDEFISDNLRMGNHKIVVIHGLGMKVLSSELRRLFKKDKRVIKMYHYGSNLGMTIMELNKEVLKK